MIRQLQWVYLRISRKEVGDDS
ncbi:hypothetical protein RHRU231_820054 [Rhodococcus ruber]|uniref:Uncharacterized protein n=1 Tax=Rhodococcus ruber TaxID=1830 RepID=A0A098BRG3_9NOCA|nr:hypothetical protein RHRU231_820054 [Rhodococcus ruber]